MRRFAVVLAAAVGLIAACGVPFTAAAVQAPPRAQFRFFICRRAVLPAHRFFSVAAMMRPVPNTRRMALSFNLLSKPNGAKAYSLAPGDPPAVWETPQPPDVGQRPDDVFRVFLPAPVLSAPVAYRYRVTFRWSGYHGHVLAMRTLLSPACYQPELRPDLLVRSITVGPVANDPNQTQYTALIENRGATGVGRFRVQFSSPPATAGDTPVIKTHSVPALGSNTSREVTFVGPACSAGTAPTISVDPAHQTEDFNWANNSLTVPAACPTLTSQPATH